MKIINQCKAFLDNVIPEGIDNGRQKTRNHGEGRHCRRRAIYWLLRRPKLVTLNPKLKSTGAGRYQLLPVGGCHRAQLGLKDFFRKVRTLWHCRYQGAWRFTYDWSWWYPSGNRPLQQYLASLPGAGYGQFEHKADSLIAKFKEAGVKSLRRLMYEQSHRDYLRLVICIIVCLSWAVNHYRDNAITYKAQRDKNARELKLANAAITDMQMRQRDVAAPMQKIHEGVSWC